MDGLTKFEDGRSMPSLVIETKRVIDVPIQSQVVFKAGFNCTKFTVKIIIHTYSNVIFQKYNN